MVSALTAPVVVAVWFALTASPPSHAPGCAAGVSRATVEVVPTADSRPRSCSPDDTEVVEAAPDWPGEAAEVDEDDGEPTEERDGFTCWGLFVPAWCARTPPPPYEAPVAQATGAVGASPLYLRLVRLNC
jgi:hypothetical protein